jgi:hypothetical protein
MRPGHCQLSCRGVMVSAERYTGRTGRGALDGAGSGGAAAAVAGTDPTAAAGGVCAGQSRNNVEWPAAQVTV